MLHTQSSISLITSTIESYQTELNTKLLNLTSYLDKELESYNLSEPTMEDYERDDIYRMTNELFAHINQVSIFKQLSIFFVIFIIFKIVRLK